MHFPYIIHMKGLKAVLFICLTSANEMVTVPDNEMLDACLMRIAQKDTDALGELYERTKNAVYSYALSIMHSPYEAEDVMHDCYLRVFASAASYKSGGKPMAWIMTIAKNLCYMRFRDRKKTEFISDEDLQRYISDNTTISHEDGVILMECMNTLSDEERNIIVLHAVAGLKHREIAQVTGLALPTVLSKYRRALNKLKKILADDNGSEGGNGNDR